MRTKKGTHKRTRRRRDRETRGGVRERDLRVGGAREDLGEDEEDVPLGERVNGAHDQIRSVPRRTRKTIELGDNQKII